MLSLLPFLVIIVVFWFFLIRPQQRRQRQAQQMQAELAPGTEVMLTSGIFGTVGEVTDDYVLVEVSENTSVKVIRRAIGQVLPDDFGAPQAETDEPTGALDPGESVESVEPVEPIEPIEGEERR